MSNRNRNFNRYRGKNTNKLELPKGMVRVTDGQGTVCYREERKAPVVTNSKGVICVRGQWCMSEATWREMYALGLFDMLKGAIYQQVKG